MLSLPLYMQLTYARSTHGSGHTLSFMTRVISVVFSARGVVSFGTSAKVRVFPFSFSFLSSDFS